MNIVKDVTAKLVLGKVTAKVGLIGEKLKF